MEEEEEGANIWHQSTEEEDEVGRPLWKLGIPYGRGEEREALWEPRKERGEGL